MHQDQCQSVVQDVQRTAIDGDDRDHQNLERNDHGCDHQRKDQPAGNPVITGNNECTHTCEEQGEHC